MYEIRKINILDAGKYSSLMSFFASLVPFAFYAILFLIMWGSSGSFYYSSPLEWLGIIFMFGFPLIVALIGFVFGVVYAAVYNLIASKIGGIRIDIAFLEEDNKNE